MSQRVELDAIGALVALAVELVRLLDAIAVEQQQLDDLGAVVLRGEYDGRDVGRELRVLRLRLPERVGRAVDELLLVELAILRMVEYDLGDARVAEEYGEEERLLHLARVALGQEQEHDLDMLVGDGQAERRATQVVRDVDVELLERGEYGEHCLVVAIRARVHERAVQVDL